MKDYKWYCWIQYLHWVKNNKLAKIWVWYLTDKWINPEPFVFTSDYLCNSKERKEIIRELRRMLDDLEKSPVYKEWPNWIYTEVSPYKWK